MNEMIYTTAVFRPVSSGLEKVDKPSRKNVKIWTDPQTVAAMQRRTNFSETKMFISSSYVQSPLQLCKRYKSFIHLFSFCNIYGISKVELRLIY